MSPGQDTLREVAVVRINVNITRVLGDFLHGDPFGAADLTGVTRPRNSFRSHVVEEVGPLGKAEGLATEEGREETSLFVGLAASTFHGRLVTVRMTLGETPLATVATKDKEYLVAAAE